MNGFVKVGAIGLVALFGLKAGSTLLEAKSTNISDPAAELLEHLDRSGITATEPFSEIAEVQPADAGSLLQGGDAAGGGETPAGEVAADGTPAGEAGNAAALSAPTLSATIPEILASLQAERKELARRAAELDEQKAEIALSRAALEQEAKRLEALRQTITALLAQTEGNRKDDVLQLVNIYRAMKPAQAAEILDDADLEMTVTVLAAMGERYSGPIIAVMDKKRSRLITKIIHERSKLPGDQKF